MTLYTQTQDPKSCDKCYPGRRAKVLPRSPTEHGWRGGCDLLANFIAAITSNLTLLTRPPKPNPARFLSMSAPFLEVVDQLFHTMDELVPTALYKAAQVRPIPGRIQGMAFFPGGSGLDLRDPAVAEFPVGGVMILGHNFDSEAGFQASFQRGHEVVTKGTWGALLELLLQADIPSKQCFFTNAFMGLCEISGRGRRQQEISGPRQPGFPGGLPEVFESANRNSAPSVHSDARAACAAATRCCVWRPERLGGEKQALRLRSKTAPERFGRSADIRWSQIRVG